MFTGSLGDFSFDMNWYQSAVEDPTALNDVPEPVTNYYSYLGNTLISARKQSVKVYRDRWLTRYTVLPEIIHAASPIDTRVSYISYHISV